MDSKSLQIKQTFVVKAKSDTVQKKFVIKHIKPSSDNVQVTGPSKPTRITPPQHHKMVQVSIPTVHLEQGAQLGRFKGSGIKKYSLNVPLIQVNIPRLEVSRRFSNLH